MRRLAEATEIIDGALTDAGQLDGNLRDLRRINRLTGGTELSIRALRELVLAMSAGGFPAPAPGRRGPMHVLDVGTGAADMPLAFVGARGPWASIRVTAVDSRTEVVAAARRISPALDGRADVSVAVADGRSLPYGDGTFDVAHASLVLHHLQPAEAVGFLRELARVARLGVVLNDLRRGTLHWLGAVVVLRVLARSPWTLHDGPLSVRRAYTPAEARALLDEAGLRPVAELHGFAWHRWAMAAVRR
jgi:ubiquinone/menaquinone biosynthesis C-methylase UbiE